MRNAEHWELLYRSKAPTELSWYQADARLSLALIREVAPDQAIPVIDVGGGASTLVDGLLDAGYRAVTVLDLAPAALALARQRLAGRAAEATWIAADILEAPLTKGGYGVWHDRAAFHFLTDPADRARYVAQVRRAVRPGGHVIVASFAADGPRRCSGLDVMRYSPDALSREFGEAFQLLNTVREDHRTPGGAIQAFSYCVYRAAL